MPFLLCNWNKKNPSEKKAHDENKNILEALIDSYATTTHYELSAMHLI